MGTDMGLIASLVWVNTYSRKQCRSLFWRVKAALKKAVKNGGNKQIRFQYDPCSYALNFDDGCYKLGELGECQITPSQHAKPQFNSDVKNSKWAYVLWVKAE